MIAALLLAAGSSAPILWNDLTLGMSKAEVQALHPTGKAELGGGCQAEIKPVFNGDKLSSVVLRVKPSDGDGLRRRAECSTLVEEGLSKRYGSPADVRFREGSPPMKETTTLTFWQAGNVVVRHSTTSMTHQTAVVYEFSPPAVKPDLSQGL